MVLRQRNDRAGSLTWVRVHEHASCSSNPSETVGSLWILDEDFGRVGACSAVGIVFNRECSIVVSSSKLGAKSWFGLIIQPPVVGNFWDLVLDSVAANRIVLWTLRSGVNERKLTETVFRKVLSDQADSMLFCVSRLTKVLS